MAEENNIKPILDVAKNKIVQTYAEDMVKVIEDDKGGLIKKIIHSEEEHEIEKKELSPESKKNKFFMFLGLLLILAAFAALVFLVFKRSIPSVSVQEQFVPIIFSDKNALIEIAELKKDQIAKKVSDEVKGTTVKQGGIEGIYLTLNKSPVGFRKFLEVINSNFVFDESNFIDDNFLMGVVKNKDQHNDFFILLKVRSIPDVFNVMHAWENKMFSDLHGFLGIDISPETKQLLTENFEDGIAVNKNARILYGTNDQGEKKIAMMYIFADDNSIIITNSENAVKEIILRLASSQIKK